MEPPILEEGPFTLRLPRAEDVSWIYHACQDEDIQRFTMVPSPYAPADAVAFVVAAAELCAAGTALHLVVGRTESGELLGAGSLKLALGDGRGEIGYWVEREARRSGVASATVRALERFAAGSAGVRQVTLRIAEENFGSRALAEAGGYALEGPDDALCNGLAALRYTKVLASD